uniref:death ligand signal enhancer isoform X2 n=1 Tax=Pristiophorus japonicus TaxID=55135 RepID=UPI00398EC9F3
MWRLKALLGRVLHRWPLVGPSPSLRLPPTHCAEDDLLNPSALTSTRLPFENSSTDSQNGDAGERRKRAKEQSARFYSKQLPRFSGLDAVGWGAAAVVLLQFARHLHRQFSHHSGPRENDAASHFCVRGIVASTLAPDTIKFSRSILPRSAEPHTISNSTDRNSVSAGSSSPAHGKAAALRTEQVETDESVEQDEPLFIKDAQCSECGAAGGNGQRGDLQREELNPEEVLNRATSNLQGATASTISSILNIIGIENLKAKDYEMAFSCFMMAARQGYSKAQYNVGVCYELGRGTAKDIEKAALYYSQAAAQGHSMAQYRWARYLLHAKPARVARDTQNAIQQLEKTAKSGLKEDPSSQYHLGICYQKGWGVTQDDRRAAELYQKAAALEHADAQCALGVFHQQGLGGLPVNILKAMELYQSAARSGSDEAVHNLQLLMKDLQVKGSLGSSRESAVLRTVMSSPCLRALGRVRPRPSEADEDWGGLHPPPGVSSTRLPHSWSTGSLRAFPLSGGAGRPGAAIVACLHRHAEFPAGHLSFRGSVPGVG